MRASKVSKKNKSHRRFTSTNEAKYYKKYHTDIFLLVRKHKILKYFQSHFLFFRKTGKKVSKKTYVIENIILKEQLFYFERNLFYLGN